MAEVQVSSLTKVFPNGVRAIDALDLSIAEGEFFALLGPSGCGKTTLLRTIAGLESPTEGAISIGGRDVTATPPGERDVAMVFQDYALYPHMTVTDNISYPLKVRRVGRDERRDKAAGVARGLQVEHLLDRRPGQLSGGQQQRVAVARAIVYKPSVFLFDEPLSNLDARLRLEARTFLKRLQKELGSTTIYVTHDQSEALALADRIAIMKDGRIRQLAPAEEIYNRPASLFVASFIGSVPMNLLAARLEDGSVHVGETALQVPDHARDERLDSPEVVLGIRPEHATLSTKQVDGALQGRVSVIELLGNEYLVTVENGSTAVQATSYEAPEVGTSAWITFDPARALLYRRSDGGLVGTPELEDSEVDEVATAAAGLPAPHQLPAS
ncbi:MAG: ABC transporter ATP-binding protein [Actinomycetota bacterium]